ncbi:MAG: AsmA family protein [Defluviicoccus sp.]
MRSLRQAGIWLFAAVFSLISVVVAAIVVITLVYDWNDLRGPISRLASTALGRKLTIDGNLNVDLGWTTRIRVENLALANAKWARDPEMVRIGVIDAAVDVRELLKGRVRLPSLALDRPDILLARNENGETNWTFGSGEDSAPGKRQDLPIIEELSASDGRIRFQDPGPSKDINLELKRLTLRQPPPEQDIRLEGNGLYQKQPFSLRLAAGSFAALEGSETPYPVDLNATAGDIKASVSGSIGDPAQMQGLNLAVDFKGDNAADLFPLIGLALPPTPPYHVKGQLQRKGTAWTLANFNWTLGSSDLRGTLSADFSKKRPLLTGDVASNRLDLKDLAPAAGAPREKGPGGELQNSDRPGRVLPSQDIDLTRLRAMDARVTFRSNRIVTKDVPIDRLEAKVALEAGTLHLQPVTFGIGPGRVELYTTLHGERKPVDVDMDLRVQQINLKDLVRNTKFVEESAGIFGGRAKLSSQGASVADILGNASGQLYIVMSGGRMSHLLVEIAGLDIVESLGLAIEGDKPTPIRCLVTDLRATNGVFQAEQLVLDTNDTVIVGSGSVNMGDETLHLTMTPYSKDFSPLTLRSPISIGGTFKNPDAFPDPIRTGNQNLGEKIFSAIVTPILGLMPPFDTELGKDTDCRSLTDRAKRVEPKSKEVRN